MKSNRNSVVLFALPFGLVVAAPAFADSTLLMRHESMELKVGGSSQGVVYLEKLPDTEDASPWTFTIQTGFGSLTDLKLKNSYYRFDYSEKEASLWSMAASWEVVPFGGKGQLGFKAGIGYATSRSTINLVGREASPLRLHLIPVTVGALYLADFHPALKLFTPALELGGGYQFHTQRGDTDGSEVAGGMGFVHASLGLRHSLSWAGATGFSLATDLRTAFTPDSEVGFSARSVTVGISAEM